MTQDKYNGYMKEHKVYDDNKGWIQFDGHLIASYSQKTKRMELSEFLFLTERGEFLLEISDIHLVGTLSNPKFNVFESKPRSKHFYYIAKTLYKIAEDVETSYQAIFLKMGLNPFTHSSDYIYWL